MGRTRNHRARATKNKQYKKHHDTKRRRRDVDQVQDDLAKEELTDKKMEFELDEDLPGLGQYYCTPCGRHFNDAATLEAHEKTKVHARRLKDVRQEKYTQEEADRGAGKTVEKLPPAHPELVKARDAMEQS